MAALNYDDWLSRGRAHQQQGRAIDAMLCYRQAIRQSPNALAPRFHVGEIFWQLAAFSDAIAAWREACALAPNVPEPHAALAEALLATGDAAAAREVNAKAGPLTGATPRSALIDATARLMLAAQSAEAHAERCAAAGAAADATRVDPELLVVATIVGPLALALDALPRGPQRDEAIRPIVEVAGALGDASTLPPLLVALVAEQLQPQAQLSMLLARAGARAYAAAEHDALRRLANVAARNGQGQAMAEFYARMCSNAFAAPAALTWPRRTAGERTRVIVLTAPELEPAAAAALEALAGLPGDVFELTRVVLGPPLPGRQPAAGDALGIGVLSLPAQPDLNSAKLLAARDADVLIDLCGLGAAAGPLLAARPARTCWTMATLAARNVEPLVDRVLADAPALCSALVALRPSRSEAAGTRCDPAAMAALWNEALLAHQHGDHRKALAAYDAVLEQQPEFASAHYLRGIVLRDSGQGAAARAAFDAALAAMPGYLDATVAAAGAAIDAREPQHAVALCERAVAQSPDKVALWRALGLAQLARRDAQAAASALARALGLAPTDADLHYNLGVAFQQVGNFAEAARAYQRALFLRPEFVDADYNLGVLFQEQGAVDAAVTAYGNALRGDPRHVRSYKNLGELLWSAGRIESWVQNYARFAANCPTALPLVPQALEVCQLLGDFPQLETYLDGLRKERFAAANEIELVDTLEQLLYLLLFFDVEDDLVFKLAQTYDSAARHVYGEPLPRAAARRPGRLRIGYVSGDLRNHVQGKMMWQAIQHHDKSRFELFFYSLSEHEDEWTANYRGIADHYELIAGIDERAAAMRIAGDDLDILVDLATHTKGAKPGIFALKPARVQVTHVASAGTLGLSAVDYKLTDAYADLPQSQELQLESFLAMQGCVYPYRHIPPATDHPFHRAAMGISSDAVIVGAFCSALKLSRRCLQLWRDVLNRIPKAVLAFSPVDPAQRVLYVRIAAAGGIAPERIIFLPQGRTDAENQARYNLVDFVLDPMPYGGVNGTLEALDMGVPVITLTGKRHAERTGYSMLTNLGVTQTIAQTGREYVAIAERLANDPAFMREIRAAIRAGIERSPLTDMRAYTRNLEAAYTAALEQKYPAALAAAEGR